MFARKRFTKAIIFSVVFLLITGICFAAGQNAGVNGKKEMLIVTDFLPESLDPAYLDTQTSLHFTGVIEYLARISSDGKVEPELAKSFRNISSNTWEIKLRPNVKFWSGKMVDAKAVQASLERSRKLSPQAEQILSGVQINVIDNLTLHLITESPNPFLLTNIATSTFLAIHNADAYGDKLNPLDLKAMDTTGFYRVVQFEPREKMVVARFNGYWGKRPKLDRIVFTRIADPQSLVIEALSGKPHIVRSIPPEGVALIKKSKEMKLLQIKNPGITSLYLNTRLPQLADVRVRQAIGWGIDRQEIINLGYDGIGVPAPSWYASNSAYPEAKKTGFIKYDPKRAGQMLDEAGWSMDQTGYRKKNGQTLKLIFITYGIHKAACEAIQSQLKKIGIDIEIQYSKDWGFVITQMKEEKWAAALISEESFSLSDLWRHFATEGDINYSHFDDKIMNRLIENIGNSFDVKTRHNLTLDANKRAFETAILIPVMGPSISLAVNNNVKGYKPHYSRFWEYLVTPDLDLTK